MTLPLTPSAAPVSVGTVVPTALKRRRRRTVPVLRSQSNGVGGRLAVGVPADVTVVREYVRSHLFELTLNVKALRSACAFGDHNISSRFHHVFGVTIAQHILRSRMDAALILLATSDVSIVEVAYQVGYSHVQTFYRIFARRFGCTPGSYRGNHRNSQDAS